ncbi:unnamed protein product [Paramecium primaurelia]|uniref:Uncharacterized protein n=1 Tax=Paramecium primaurelia TaxID=5886 RepID=A0A8S1NKZ8_PARPR|nr:unnamed protein product [Paramecium primaurelia]
MEFTFDNSKMHQLSNNQLIQKEEISFQKKNIIIKNLITQAIKFQVYKKFLPIQTIYQGFLQTININCITTNEQLNSYTNQKFHQQNSLTKNQLRNRQQINRVAPRVSQQLIKQKFPKKEKNTKSNWIRQLWDYQSWHKFIKWIVGSNKDLRKDEYYFKKRIYKERNLDFIYIIHPDIVQLLDVIYTEVYLQIFRPNNLIPEIEAKNIFFQVVKAINYCHSKYIAILLFKYRYIETQNQKIFQSEKIKQNQLILVLTHLLNIRLYHILELLKMWPDILYQKWIMENLLIFGHQEYCFMQCYMESFLFKVSNKKNNFLKQKQVSTNLMEQLNKLKNQLIIYQELGLM